MADTIYIGSDHTITLEGLTGNGVYLNAATVTYALKTSAGTTVTNGTGSLTYTAASNGDYTGTIESTVTSTLTDGALYRLEITITESPYNDFRRLDLWATYRGET